MQVYHVYDSQGSTQEALAAIMSEKESADAHRTALELSVAQYEQQLATATQRIKEMEATAEQLAGACVCACVRVCVCAVCVCVTCTL